MRLSDGTGRNGIITSYIVTYTPVGGSGDTITIHTRGNGTLLKITGLEEKLVYVVSIAANSSQGVGPAIVVRLPTMGKSCDATNYNHVTSVLL